MISTTCYVNPPTRCNGRPVDDILSESWYLQDFTVPIALLFIGSQKTTTLVTLVTSVEHGMCCNFVHNTQWPDTTIRIKMKSRSCSCIQSGSTMVNHFDTSWGNEYSIHMVNSVRVHVDAISPSLRIVWRSNSVTSTTRSSLRHAIWRLFQRNMHASWIKARLNVKVDKLLYPQIKN